MKLLESKYAFAYIYIMNIISTILGWIIALFLISIYRLLPRYAKKRKEKENMLKVLFICHGTTFQNLK